MNEYRVTDHGVRAGAEELQTKEFQSVLDLCKENGGKVIVPRGEYRVAALRMWSDTTLYLESGAKIIGSDECDDYEVFEFPEGMVSHSDMEMIPEWYHNKPWRTYRRAIISVYCGKNVAIIGEPGSFIDGSDCFDPDGEEGYRGPHGIYITNVENLVLKGYTIENCGNFEHQIDTCRHITAKGVTCLGGSDGFHLHCCDNILIEDCVFHTGDDCIGGINMTNMILRRCEFNTSCDVFRAGGQHILVEDCRVFGPGIYPHTVTIMKELGIVGTQAVKDKSRLPGREAGRHNLICVWVHFASKDQPDKSPSEDIVFRNCTFENIDKFLVHRADFTTIDTCAYLTDMRLENITARGVLTQSVVSASAEHPLTVTMKNVSAYGRDGKPIELFSEESPNLTVAIE